MRRARSYTGNECPAVKEHGPMIPYPGGLYYCPNAAHARAEPPQAGVFQLTSEGWQMAVPLGGWARVTESAAGGVPLPVAPPADLHGE